MGIYNLNKTNDLNAINEYFSKNVFPNEFEHNFDLNVNECSEHDKNVFFNSVLSSAWTYFFDLFNERMENLDRNTKFNQEYISRPSDFKLEDYLSDPVGFLSDLLRVLFEYQYWTGQRKTHRFLDADILTTLDKLYSKSEFNKHYQFRWIRDDLSVALAKFIIDSPDFKSAREFVSQIESRRAIIISEIDVKLGEVSEKIEANRKHATSDISKKYSDIIREIRETEGEINESLVNIKFKSDQVTALEERVSKLRTEYNFIGLSAGFSKIKDKKEVELRTSEVYYKNLFGCLFIAPIIIIAIHLFKSELYPSDFSVIFLIFPFLTIELVLIYFFRLSYLEAKSIRTQLIQIELRLSLCASIENYVEFRKNNIEAGSKVFDIFDSLIFSPIQVNDNNIPSMFDGVDAIADLANKVMKSRG
ncbi:TPA: hypothetical protein ACKP33_004077 [Serratia marcescens]|nr:hypothetical protein FG173_10130 [Serratia marcescens]